MTNGYSWLDEQRIGVGMSEKFRYRWIYDRECLAILSSANESIDRFDKVGVDCGMCIFNSYMVHPNTL